MSSITRELQPGISLTREAPDSSTLMFYVQNDKPNLLQFTMDISTSTGVVFNPDSGSKVVVDVFPYDRKLLAHLVLSPGAKVNHKFTFLQKPPPPNSGISKIVAKDEEMIPTWGKECHDLVRTRDINTFSPELLDSVSSKHFVDPFFPPGETSILAGRDQPLSTIVHWRRPKDFFKGEFQVFLQAIEPNDIKQGLLGDCWLMCALASLAERPQLVERLFETREVNSQGIYRIRFCKGGEWKTVTVDDYFPCFPMDTPIFSRSHGNELWVLLIEKAYAKLHGSYLLLKGGWAHEGMLDLTGCPTISYDFDNADVKELIAEDFLWPLLRGFDQEAAMLSASTAGEDRWSETRDQARKGGLISGHAYSVIQVREAYGQRLLNIRNPWGTFEWDGPWSDNSRLWTDKMKAVLKPVLEEDDGTFWMCYDDFLNHFQSINVCLVKPFFEARAKGVFQRKREGDYDSTYSSFYFVLTADRPTRIYLGLHQEDERILGAESKRPYLDIGIAVLEQTQGGIKLLKRKENIIERQVEMELELKPDRKYIVVPRTSGCILQHEKVGPQEQLMDGTAPTPLFRSTLLHLFRAVTIRMTECISFQEFSVMMKVIGETIDESEFQSYLDKYSSTELGLTEEGFVDYMSEKALALGEVSGR